MAGYPPRPDIAFSLELAQSSLFPDAKDLE